jgi:hypothetical protein
MLSFTKQTLKTAFSSNGNHNSSYSQFDQPKVRSEPSLGQMGPWAHGDALKNVLSLASSSQRANGILVVTLGQGPPTNAWDGSDPPLPSLGFALDLLAGDS